MQSYIVDVNRKNKVLTGENIKLTARLPEITDWKNKFDASQLKVQSLEFEVNQLNERLRLQQ